MSDRIRKFTKDDWAYKPGPDWRGRLEGLRAGTDATLAFYETTEIGMGPVLHVHPYAETFIVLEGHARYQIGDRVIEAQAGDVLIGPADIPHKFSNLGPGKLRTVDIHHSPEWIQTDLEGRD